MTQNKHTHCHICEPFCPIIAEVNDAGKVIALHPDRDHPSGGKACHKGLSYLEVHNDPDRLNWPQKRLNPRVEERGNFVDTDWDSTFTDIGHTLKTLREKHGPNSVAVYIGNPWAMSTPPLFASSDFLDLLETQMRFSASTLDASNKFLSASEVFGSPGSIMVADICNTDYLLCIGTNPKVSRWTLISAPNDSLDAVKRIRDRGGKVRFVNPRRIESSTPETGPTTLIKPGTDVYFLAALLNEIHLQHGFDEALLVKHGKNVEGLKKFIARFPAEKVATVTGIEATEVKQIASDLIRAKSAAVYMSTGVNQSRQGMLSYWLVEMINFATGNLGRKGGVYKPAGLMDMYPPANGTVEVKTAIGTFTLPDPVSYAALPMTLLPDLIECGDIRALIVLGGNPLITAGGESAMRKAFEKLDLLVSVDLYRCTTGEMADYVLPATDWLERMDINFLANGAQPIPYVQYADAIEPPAHGRRNGWWIIQRLCQAIGLPSALDDSPHLTDGTDAINGLLSARGLSIEEMRALPHQTATFDQAPYDSVFDRCVQHPDKKIDCCPSAFNKSGLFERCEKIFDELSHEPEQQLKLVSLRTPYMQNSWLTNTDKFRRGKHGINPLNICEADATAQGLFEGDEIRVYNEYGSVNTQVQINNDLRPGVVAMSHGYGNAKAFGLRTSSEKAGANYNALTPMGREYEPMSHMSWLTAVPVKLEKLHQSRL